MINIQPDEEQNYIEAANQYFNAKMYQEALDVLLQMQSYFGIEEPSSTRLEFVYSAMNQPR